MRLENKTSLIVYFLSNFSAKNHKNQLYVWYPTLGWGTPFPPFFLVHSLPHYLLFFTFSLFPFFICFTYFLLLSIPFLSTRIAPLCFQAGGRRRRPNLGLVCYIHFVLSVLLSYDLFWCSVLFGLG